MMIACSVCVSLGVDNWVNEKKRSCRLLNEDYKIYYTFACFAATLSSYIGTVHSSNYIIYLHYIKSYISILRVLPSK